MKQEFSIVINKPVEEVFAFVANPDNSGLWQSSVVQFQKTSEGEMGAGATFAYTAKFLGRSFESTATVTEFVPNESLTIKTDSGPLPNSFHYTFEPTGDNGTRLNVTFEGEFGGLFKLAEPLVARSVKRQGQTDLETLKDLVEA